MHRKYAGVGQVASKLVPKVYESVRYSTTLYRAKYVVTTACTYSAVRTFTVLLYAMSVRLRTSFVLLYIGRVFRNVYIRSVKLYDTIEITFRTV